MVDKSDPASTPDPPAPFPAVALSQIDINAAKVAALYAQWDKLIWKLINSAMRAHNVTNNNGDAGDIHGLVWLKVLEKIHLYRESLGQIQTWLGIVTQNVIKDYFKVEWRHTGPLVQLMAADIGRGPAHRGGPGNPLRRRRKAGASPADSAPNASGAVWDAAHYLEYGGEPGLQK